MENRHHLQESNQATRPVQASLEQKEIRHLPVEHIKKLGDILAEDDQWIEFMSNIPGGKAGRKRFDKDDVEILVQALRSNHKYTGFELLVQEWGTMEEWGLSESGRRSRPMVQDLLIIFEDINNYRAASYVHHEILGREPLQSPMSLETTGALLSLPVDTPPSSLDREVFHHEDSMLESTIENSTSLEDNSDIFDPSMPIPPEHALDVPHVKYRYLDEITNGFNSSMYVGKGGFSVVYKGITSRSKKLLAVKMLKDNPDTRRLMNFEVENLKRLKHPNIIDLYGYSNDAPSTPCIIYPLMVNGSLNARLAHSELDEKHLTSKQRLDIAYGVSKGICHIHRLQEGPKVLIHRDIKSSNILLDHDLEPKVADFGLLRLAVSGEDLESTCTQAAKGTPAYMPPEAIRGDCSAKWDVWSFGVVLLEVLTSLPVIDRSREEQDILSHVSDVVGDKGSDCLQTILDPCWHNEDMISFAILMYDLAFTKCLVTRKSNRANMQEVVEQIGNIVKQCE